MMRERIYVDNNAVGVIHSPRRPDEYEIECQCDPNDVSSSTPGGELLIEFQAGPVKLAGVNGVQVEHLLAVCKHRLEFLSRRLLDGHTEQAIKQVGAALAALDERTAARIKANVEGTELPVSGPLPVGMIPTPENTLA